MAQNIRALEFYSGTGGMHYALAAAVPGATVVRAFDISPAANDTWASNFGGRPWQGDIAAVPQRLLDDPTVNMWLLAPPCQPYTRRGNKKGADDARAGSFMTLLGRLPSLKSPPAYLLMENVVGFEASSTADDLRSFLGKQAYAVQEFQLSPTQLGVPYSRPRYFCLARKLGADGCGAFPLPSQLGMPLDEPPAELLRRHQAAAADDPTQRDTLQQEHGSSSVTQPLDRTWSRSAAVAQPQSNSTSAAGAVAAVSPARRRLVQEFLVAHPAAEGIPPAAFAGVINRAEARRNGARSANGTAARRHHSDQGGSMSANGAMTEGGAAAAAAATASAATRGGNDPTISSVEHGAGCQQPAAAAAAARAADAVQSQLPNQDEQPASGPAQPLDGRQEAHYQRQPLAGVLHQQQHQPQEQEQAQQGDCDTWARYRFPDAELAARGIVLDVASPQSAVVNCFTKSYGTYSKGSGSVLATENLHLLPKLAAAFPQYHAAAAGPGAELPAARARPDLQPGEPVGEYVQVAAATEAAAALGLKAGEPLVPTPAPLLAAMRALRLRYFTPAEVAALHGYPPSFRFPPHLTLKQRYGLLGNSLSVDVVAALLQYLVGEGCVNDRH